LCDCRATAAREEPEAIDIAGSGPVVLSPDLSKLIVVGLTRELAETYVPMTITVSYAGQDGTPEPFSDDHRLAQVGNDWKIASEIILPVPPTPAVNSPLRKPVFR
jgi:hypothetical protein